ncbi:MAG: histidine phosphatase family protein [Lachnospiraceae bacterium]|nr:histidine phosphatase family protein [Lachnospiraceae bacterium]
MLYIMRHGVTDWNQEYRIQGRVDIPLNEEGRRMAAEAAEKYQDIHFDLCYCSPLKRARETAEIFFAGKDTPIIYDDRLREMSFGICEGTQNVFEKPDCPLYNLFQDPEHYDPPAEAESFAELYARTGAFLEEMLPPEVTKEKCVLIIGHGAMNRSIINRIRNIPLKDYWGPIPNCELVRLI